MKAWSWLIGAAVLAVALVLVLAPETPPDPSDLGGDREPPGREAPEPLETAAHPPEPEPAPADPAPALEDGDPAAPARIPQQVLSRSFEYHDGGRKVKVWRNPRVLLEFRMPREGHAGPPPPPSAPVKGAALVRTNRFTRIWLLPEGSDAHALADHLQASGAGDYSPAFHTAPSSASNLRGLPGGVIVQFRKDWDAARIKAWAEAHALSAMRKMTIVPNWYTFATAPGMESLETAGRLYATGEVSSATPNWWRDQRLR